MTSLRLAWDSTGSTARVADRQSPSHLRARGTGPSGLGATRKKNCYLSSQYHRLVRRLGRKKAVVAVAHSVVVIIYHVLQSDQSYTELGGDYFDRQSVEQQRASHIWRLQMLGLEVKVEALPAAA